MTRQGHRPKPFRDEPVEVWQATYASLAMILVVFFVMLVSYAQISGRSAMQIRAALGVNVDRAAHSGGTGTPAARAAAAEREAGGQADILAGAGGVLRGALERANLSRECVLEKTRSGWRMVLKTEALFAGDRGRIREARHAFLREVANAASQGGLAVRVEVFGAAAVADRGIRPSWATPAGRAAGVVECLESGGIRFPLSFHGYAAVPPAVKPDAGGGGNVVITFFPSAGAGP
jgi:hypothetical protein